MKMTFAHRTGITGLVLIALGLLVVPIARLATDDPTVLEACINPGNGGMRLIEASVACHKNESRVQWNVTGPIGPVGPPGPPGPPGPSSGGAPFTWVCTPAHYR